MKKRLCVALIVLLVAAAFGFAAGSSEPESSSGSTQVTPPGTFPVVNEQATLSIFAVAPNFQNWDIETNWFTNFYEEKTNVHIDWELVAGGDAGQIRQKVNLKLASGDYPDVFSKINFSRAEQVRYGSEGVFVPIEDLVNSQTVHIKKAFESVDRLWDSCVTPDGHMYGLPNPVLYVHGTIPWKIWYFQPWLDTLGLDTPETTEEYYQMLKAFQEDDPNGNGQADEVPYATTGPAYQFLMNSFTWYNGDLLKSVDGKISMVATDPGYREGLRYFAKLYDEGLYVQDFFTLDVNQIREFGEAKPNRLGAAQALWPGTISRNTGENENFWGFEALMPLAGPDGTRQIPFNHLALGPGGGVWNITSKCESPELAMRWLDWIWGFDGYHSASHGPKLDISAEEGPGWREGRPGEEGAGGEQALVKRVPSEDPNAYDNIGWGTNAIVPRYLSYEWHTGLVVDSDDPWRSRDLWQATVDMDPWVTDLVVPPLFMDEDVASEIAEIETALENAVREATAQFIFGSRNIDSDSEWNSYVRDIERLGATRLIDLYQQEYDKNYQ